MTVTDFALRQGRALLFVVLVAAGAGLYVAAQLPKGVYPEVDFPREEVVATLAGAPSATVLAGVTRPLEEALASVPGVEHIRSRTIRGAVDVSLFFAPGTDMVQAHAVVLGRVAEIRSNMPEGTEVVADRVTVSGFPILSLNVEGPYPAERLYSIAAYTLAPALSGLPDIGGVVVQSSDIPELAVLLDPARLAAAHLTWADVSARLKATNMVRTVARVEDAHELRLGIVTGELQSPEDVAAVVVGGSPEQPVRISDLGRVEQSVEPRTRLVRVDGQPGAIINIARRVGGDILTLDHAVHERLAELQPSLPPGLRVVPVYEQAVFVSDAVKGVRDAVLFGAFFAIGVLALFLRDLRATLIAALSLPLTLGASLLMLAAFGQSLNLMTLGGLAVAVGLVIDDAVVVVEAVHKHLEAGLPPREAAARGTSELFWPVVGTTATTVVVFLPLGLLQGVVGAFFSAFSLALASAVLLSLPIALMVLPAIAAHSLRPVHKPSRGQGLARRYSRGLDWVLAHPWAALVPAAGVVAVGAFALTQVATDFLPQADEGAYVIDYFAPVGASLDEANQLALHIEQVVRNTPEVLTFSRRLGAELGPATATLPSSGDVAVRLNTERQRDIEAIMDAQRAALADRVPGLRIEFIQVLADMLGDLQGAPEPVEVKIFGPDPDVLRKLAAEARARIEKTPGLVDFFGGDVGCVPEARLRVDTFAAGRFGFTPEEVATQLEHAHLGVVATQLRRPDRLEGVRVRADPALLGGAGTQSLLRPDLLTSNGERVPVSAVGTWQDQCPPAELLREDHENMVHLTARLSGVSLGTAVGSVRRELADWKLPVGYRWELGGLLQQQKQSFRALTLALVVAVLAVTAVLLLQLRSLKRTLAVLAAAPVAIFAGIFTLWVTGMSLNAASMMGAIVLVGLVVKNGILLLDHAITAQARGVPPREAMLEAATARLRPILMTTLATLVALFPLVLGVGAGASLHRPLAVVVVGGLAVSTATTLFAVPTLAVVRRRRRSPSPSAS